ncbi:hypothetical protein, partial [Sphingosinicella sp. YJ22]|uniref:hypothetical protein n=1 Tax=Sphingosinicella sp. YJ22 TaxID=1104780 RepID=UPI001A9C4041
AVTVPTQARAPLLRQASVTRAPAVAAPRPAATQRPAAAPQRTATRASSLLNERTLRELSARERSESRATAGGEGR